MVSARSALPLDTRLRAAILLEREGPASVFGPWRGDPDVTEVRWLSGGRLPTLHSALDRAAVEFARTGDPAAGLALVWLAQALVLARLEDPSGAGH